MLHVLNKSKTLPSYYFSKLKEIDAEPIFPKIHPKYFH